MYIDPGYRTETHVTLVQPFVEKKDFVKFLSFRDGLEFEDVVHRLVLLARQHDILAGDVYVPHNPAMEHEIRRHLPATPSNPEVKR